jgi:hypothetical protein
MQVVDYRFSVRTQFGGGRQPFRDHRGKRLRVDSEGRFVWGNEIINLYGPTIQEHATYQKSDQDIYDFVDRVVASGQNFIRIFLAPGRRWLESTTTNWGARSEDATDGGMSLVELALVQFDKLIAYATDQGLFLKISCNSYTSPYERNGQVSGQETPSGYSMDALPTRRARRLAWLEIQFKRVLTVVPEGFPAGIKVHQLPNVIVEFDNEQAFSYTCTYQGGFDNIVNGVAGYVVHQAELFQVIRDYYSNNFSGAQPPNNRFPLTTEQAGFTGTDQDRWRQFQADTDLALVQGIIDWVRSDSPDAVVCVGTADYWMNDVTMRLNRPNVICTVHHYKRVLQLQALSGSTIDTIFRPYKVARRWIDGRAPNDSYNQAARDGLEMWQKSGHHPRNVGCGINECGDYRDASPDNYEATWVNATIALAQGWGHIVTFNEGQQLGQLFQPDPPGIIQIHHSVGHPAKQLSQIAVARLFIDRKIAALPQHITTVSLATLRSRQANVRRFLSAGVVQNSAIPTDGGERAWARRACRLELGASDNFDTSGWATAKCVDSEWNTGFQASSELWWGSPGIRYTAEQVVGWVGEVQDNVQLGQLRVDTTETVDSAVCVLRTDGPWALGSGQASFFFYAGAYNTNADGGDPSTWKGAITNSNGATTELANITGVAVGDWATIYNSSTGVATNYQCTALPSTNLGNWTSGYGVGAFGAAADKREFILTGQGTKTNTRLLVPNAATVYAAIRRDHVIAKVSNTGVLTDMGASWDGTELSWTTDGATPWMAVVPKAQARARSIRV